MRARPHKMTDELNSWMGMMEEANSPEQQKNGDTVSKGPEG